MSWQPTGGLRQEYEKLSTDRSPYLTRARDCAKLTLPTLLPPQGNTSAQKLRRGYSNFGARAVNSLSSKLLLALFPARQSFFRYELEEALIQQLGGDEMKTQIEEALSTYEKIVQIEIETSPTRTPAGEALKHLLVAGNILVYMLPEGGLKLYPLHSYVCQRDGEGNVLKTIAEDRLSPDTLPDSVRAQVIERIKARRSPEKTVTVYTRVQRSADKWSVLQEVEGFTIPESRGTYPLDSSPWLALRWTPVTNESYGRGMVEDYLGYLQSLEALTAALVKGSAIASKVVFLRNPNGLTTAKALTTAESGDVINGKPDDVHALQAEKSQDLRTTREMIADLKEELAYAFAMNQAIQRKAERVTAEEIRYMAQDLDSLLGGIYSSLSLEFQLPFLNRITLQMQKKGTLPQLPKQGIRPVVVTGLDALGRGAELDNLKAFVKDVVDLGGPEALSTYINFDDLLKRLSTSRSIRTKGLVKTPEQVAQEMQRKQMQAMVAHLGPNAVTQAGQLMKMGMAPTDQQPTP